MASDKSSAQTLFDVATIATNVLSEAHEGSVIEYSSVTNNDLIGTVEDRLTHNAVTGDILKVALNLYVGYYMQAVALMNNVGNINVRQALDRLNTKRSTWSNAKDKAQEWVSVESSAYDYPKFIAIAPGGINQVSNESVDEPKQDSAKLAMEAPNLAQGKVFEVTIENDGKKALIPVSVRISPIACNQPMFVSMYGATGGLNNSWLNRIKRWRDGELTTLGDMFFVNDIISEKAKLLKADKHNIVKQLEKKRLSNKISTLITQKTSIATASTISVISKDTANAIALSVGGKLNNNAVRNEIFQQSGLVMMMVVDEMYETVTMYFRGQSNGTELTFNECKYASKGSGPNVMEILKAFQNGQVPNI